MNKLMKLAVAGAAAICLNAQAGLVIDDFSAPQGPITATTVGTSLWSTVSSASILGGSRDIYVNKVGAAAGNVEGVTGVTAQVAGGYYIFAAQPGVKAEGRILWDGSATATGVVDSTVGLGGVNLTTSASMFVINVLSADLGFPFAIEVYSSATQWSRFETTALGPGSFNIPFVCFMANVCPFSTLTTGSGGGANFLAVTAVQAIINTDGDTAAVDLTLDTAYTPEPTSVALVGAALLGIGVARRRAKKSQ